MLQSVLMVIPAPGQYAVCAVELFNEHQLRQFMRERHAAQRNGIELLGSQRIGETVRTTNDECHCLATVAVEPKPTCELRGIHFSSAFIEQHHLAFGFFNGRLNAFILFFGPAGCKYLGTEITQMRKTFGIQLATFFNPRRFDFADGDEMDAVHVPRV